MVEGRCMKCKTNREMKDAKIEQTARGGFMARGTCVKCGTKMAAMKSKVDAEKFIKSGAAKKAY